MAAQTRYIKCRFLGPDGKPRGREYTYAIAESELPDYADGKEARVYTADGKALAVSGRYVPPSEYAAFADKIKFVTGSKPAPEPAPEPENVVQEALTIEGIPAPGAQPEDIDINRLIVVEALPVITQRLAEISAEIDKRLDAALALECSDATIAEVKRVRASLNKDFAALDERRKAVKEAVTAPYREFEAVYCELVSGKFRAADGLLKAKIADVEDERKSRKYAELGEYFDECKAAAGLPFLELSSFRASVGLSDSVTALKREAAEFIDRVRRDAAAIEGMADGGEVYAEYQRHFDLGRAVEAVRRRKEEVALAEERRAALAKKREEDAMAEARIREAIPEPPPPPMSPPEVVTEVVTESEPKARLKPLKVSFTVNPTPEVLAKLRETREFLREGGNLYE